MACQKLSKYHRPNNWDTTALVRWEDKAQEPQTGDQMTNGILVRYDYRTRKKQLQEAKGTLTTTDWYSLLPQPFCSNLSSLTESYSFLTLSWEVPNICQWMHMWHISTFVVVNINEEPNIPNLDTYFYIKNMKQTSVKFQGGVISCYKMGDHKTDQKIKNIFT